MTVKTPSPLLESDKITVLKPSIHYKCLENKKKYFSSVLGWFRRCQHSSFILKPYTALLGLKLTSNPSTQDFLMTILIWNDSIISIFTKPLLHDIFVLLNQNQGFSKIVISEIFWLRVQIKNRIYVVWRITNFNFNEKWLFRKKVCTYVDGWHLNVLCDS